MTITKDGIEAIRKERPTPNLETHHTIDGPIQTVVHSTVQADHIARVNQLDRTMQQASESLAQNYSFKSLEGLAKAQFEPKPVTPKYHQRTSPQLREPPQPRKPEGPKQRQGPTKNRPARALER